MFKIVEKKDRFILYNLYTDALVTVQKNSKKPFININDLLKDADFIKFLKQNYVYVEDGINQNLLSQYMINKSKYSNGNLMITDAVTYKCNLNCVYCMQQNTFKNVKELLPEERVEIWKLLYDITASDSISVAFFGGEPFLNSDFLIKELNYASKLGLNINKCFCVTNGVNINNELIDLINTYNFEHLQITLDGLSKTHNSRRVAKTNINCFDSIIKNIAILLKQTKIKIIVNTVLDRKNMNEYIELVDFIGENFPNYCKGNDARIIFNVGQECHPAHKSAYTIKNIASVDEYSQKIFECLNYLIDNNYKVNQPLPSPICIHRKENDLVISPDGGIYKCISGMGNKEFLLITKEELFENPMLFHIRQAALLENDINKNCKTCEYMSLCNGGCEYNAFNNGVEHECNKPYLERSINDIICLLEKIQRNNGELEIWQM